MSGYVFAWGACICCKQMFGFNPWLVPSSSAITGEREPVCRTCMHKINAKRAARGEPPHLILEGAYEPGPEEELI